MNPFSDTWVFLNRPQWPIYLLWLMLMGSAAAAAWNLRVDPAQRNWRRIWIWVSRVLLGCMWWQQTLWKLPPYYTDQPGEPNTGLIYWMGEMVQSAAFAFQGDLVKNLVLPHFYIFAPVVYLIEAFVGFSLILGLLTRGGALLGALMAINLWLGLYNNSSEWPWTYFFLILLQLTYGILQTGRDLGVDAIVVRRLDAPPGSRSPYTKLFFLLS